MNINTKVERLKGKNRITVEVEGFGTTTRTTKREYKWVAVYFNDKGFFATYHGRRDLAEKAVRQYDYKHKIVPIDDNTEEITFRKIDRDWVSSNGYTIENKVFPKATIQVVDREGTILAKDFGSIQSAKKFIKNL